MDEEATPDGKVTCCDCGRDLECCCFCDDPACRRPVCYPCLAVDLQVSLPALHGHGG